jgi:pyrroline-5-carboxylate reductase
VCVFICLQTLGNICGFTASTTTSHCITICELSVKQILGSVGEYFWVKEETMLDAVTALSGSGPAYFFLMIESMTNAGIALGLDKQIAEKLSIQTALGASTMSKQSTDSARELRAKVTSKNGTTQAAIESFQEQNFEIIISRAMRTAFERAREIGFELSDNA